jgi:hypothetical protein
MRFMMMYKPAAPETGAPPSKEYLEEMGKLIEEGMKSGTLLITEGLQPTSKGARVRLSKGKTTVIDGPFIEAKELIAGFAILHLNSLQEAIESAKNFLRCAGDGECEIRLLFEAEDFGPGCVPPQ